MKPQNLFLALAAYIGLVYIYKNRAAIGATKKSKWLKPYTGNKTTFGKTIRNKPGVYLIKSNRTGNTIYVGYSGTNVYKTMYRHFQTWNDPQQVRKVYSPDNYTARVILTTGKRAGELEKYLIEKIRPRDNKNKYDGRTSEEKAESLQSDLNAADFFKTYTQDTEINPF
jgi:excinuclease UvrABC nuclease subunit